MYYVYILLCSDNTLYTGYTDNLKKRIKRHNEGKGAKYTRGRKPCKLVYYETFQTKSEAMSREWYIKHKMTKKDKTELIQSSVDTNNKIE